MDVPSIRCARVDRNAIIAAVLVTIVASGCGYLSFARETVSFLKSARSVRIRVRDKASQGAFRDIEIVCPDRVRVRAVTPAGRLEIVAVGENAFGRVDDGLWTTVPLATINAPGLCAGSAWKPRGKNLTTLVEEATTNAEWIPKGSVRTVNGVACQTWELRNWTDGNGPKPPAGSMCVGTSDGRLMELQVPEVTLTFADWNAAIAIDRPDRIKGETH